MLRQLNLSARPDASSGHSRVSFKMYAVTAGLRSATAHTNASRALSPVDRASFMCGINARSKGSSRVRPPRGDAGDPPARGVPELSKKQVSREGFSRMAHQTVHTSVTVMTCVRCRAVAGLPAKLRATAPALRRPDDDDDDDDAAAAAAAALNAAARSVSARSCSCMDTAIRWFTASWMPMLGSSVWMLGSRILFTAYSANAIIPGGRWGHTRGVRRKRRGEKARIGHTLTSAVPMAHSCLMTSCSRRYSTHGPAGAPLGCPSVSSSTS